MPYCDVIVDITAQAVDRRFVYAVPQGLSLVPGQRVMVPFGPQRKEGIVLSLREEAEMDPERIREVLYPLEEYAAIPGPRMELAEEMAKKAHCPLAETLRLMLPAQMRGGRIRVKTESAARLCQPPKENPEKLREGKKKQLLLLLADGKAHPFPELREKVRDPVPVLRKMEQEGLIEITQLEVLRTPEGVFGGEPEVQWRELTAEQREALEEIQAGLDRHGGKFLLHGVTGSGKTEVFLAAVRQVLSEGRSAVILVPEIALTPQMVRWFRERFGPVAAVIHSRLSPGERYDEWRRIHRGEARVVIGARSAVFSPVRDLGLIVVDEEHESTYISDRHTRYDAREVAESRCAREGATLLLASATPGILSFARARRGDFTLLEMPRRVRGRPMPEVTVTDMRQELENGNRSVLGRELQRELVACVRGGGQAMLLMNRRGYHSFVSCRKCGYVVKCSHCDVSMTYHLIGGDGNLRCHYCGETVPLPAKCPSCGSPYIKFFGAGTQKVEEDARRLLPDVPMVRMDVDTTGGKDGHGKILEEFRSGRARVMIGTQMIAKGLDFPEVTLVGVVAADLTLNLPDYRSRERTFQLLTQVAGRAGRGNRPGRVIIQTYKPEDPVIGYAARQDYRAFFEAEFRRRQIAMYPPFTVMARLLVEGPGEEAVARRAAELEDAARTLLEEHPEWKRLVLLIICDTPPLKLLRGRHRRHVLFKLKAGKDAEAFGGALTEMAASGPEEPEVFLEWNPTTML